MPWNREKYERVAINTFRSLEKGIDTPEYFIKAYAKDIKMEEYESAKAIRDVLKQFDIDVKILTK